MKTNVESTFDVVLGDVFIRARWETLWTDDGKLVLDKNRPLVAGAGGINQWTEKQTQAGGWKRDVPRELDTDASDLRRASANFIVLSVTPEPPSSPGYHGRDAGYGGGDNYLVKRLADDGSFDPNGEEIRYTRRCCYNSDLSDTVTVLRNTGPNPEATKYIALSRLTFAERAALGV